MPGSPMRSFVVVSLVCVLVSAALGVRMWREHLREEPPILPAASHARSDPGARPDVYLLVVDTLRADHTSLYGYARPTTPSLERFATDAYVFENVVSASSWTLPAVGSLMTSHYPGVHGLEGRTGESSHTRLRPGLATLAEWMADAGYRTVAVVTNPWIEDRQGILRGFQEVVIRTWQTAAFVHSIAKNRLAAADSRPVFMYLHYMDVHGPYRAAELAPEPLGPLPESYLRKLTARELEVLPPYLRMTDATGSPHSDLGAYVDAYDRGIHGWDRAFGDWIDWLRERGRYENAIISVISDHGEEFVEHGGWSHGETLYQEQIDVPWLVRAPGLPGGTIDHGLISSVDVAPTLLALAGLPGADGIRGHDVLSATTDFAEPTVFSETAVVLGGNYDEKLRQTASLRGKFKLIMAGRDLCFDLESDSQERHPRQDIAFCLEVLRPLTVKWRLENEIVARSKGETRDIPIDPALAEQLKALGYVK